MKKNNSSLINRCKNPKCNHKFIEHGLTKDTITEKFNRPCIKKNCLCLQFARKNKNATR